MRVCLVSPEFAPFSGWGVGAYTSHMAAALRDAGHDVHVITAGVPALRRELESPPGQRKIPGVTFHLIDLESGRAALPHVPCRTTRGPMATHHAVIEAHRVHRFDYIEFADFYGHGYFAVQARRTTGMLEDTILGVRLHSPIFELRRINRQEELTLNTACVERLETEAIRGADVIISPSQAMLQKVGASLQLGDGPRQAVIAYPFDDAALAAMGPLERSRPDDGVTEVLFYGRLEYRKGVHLLVDAAQRLLARGIELRIRIIGVDTTTAPDGRSLRSWLGGRIEARWRDRFIFEDNRPRGMLGRALADADVCCFPSLWENFPNVCLESMAAGKAVIGSDAGGMAEIIEHGASGLLFAGGSASALEETLAEVVEDHMLRGKLAAAAPARVRALCDPGRVVSHLEQLLAQVMEPRRGGATRGGDATSRPLVSVVIPFHNMASLLPEAIASAAAQTHRPVEIVLVDDGSTDRESVALVEQLERRAPEGDVPLRVVRQAQRGLSGARNAGVRAARGDWIVPLDADDLLEPRFIEAALEVLERDPGLVMVTSWMSCFERTPEEPTVAFVPLGLDRDMLAVLNVASSCTALLRRDVLEQTGGYEESLTAFEDWDLYCTLAELGCRGAVVPEFLIQNRIRPDSMLRRLSTADRESLEARVRARHPKLAEHPDRARRMLELLRKSRDEKGRTESAMPRESLLARVLRPVLRRVARDV